MRKQNTFQSNLLKWLGGVKAKSEIGGYREEEGMGFILMSQRFKAMCYWQKFNVDVKKKTGDVGKKDFFYSFMPLSLTDQHNLDSTFWE